jgi:hypothetical protein
MYPAAPDASVHPPASSDLKADIAVADIRCNKRAIARSLMT